MVIKKGFKILFEKRVFEHTGERIPGGDLIFETGEYETRIGINLARVWMYRSEYLTSLLSECRPHIFERDSEYEIGDLLKRLDEVLSGD